MDDAHADVRQHVRLYLIVFGLLLVGTVLTVLVARVDFRGPWNVVIALAIASGKALLVAAVFMHLKWERGAAIWTALVLCAVFFVVLVVLPVLVVQDLPPQVEMGTWG